MSAVDLPLRAALDGLTGFEVLAIQKKFGCNFEELGGARTLIGAVWSYRNRTEKTEWRTVEAMTFKELQDFFAPDDAIEDPGKA